MSRTCICSVKEDSISTTSTSQHRAILHCWLVAHVSTVQVLASAGQLKQELHRARRVVGIPKHDTHACDNAWQCMACTPRKMQFMACVIAIQLLRIAADQGAASDCAVSCARAMNHVSGPGFQWDQPVTRHSRQECNQSGCHLAAVYQSTAPCLAQTGVVVCAHVITPQFVCLLAHYGCCCWSAHSMHWRAARTRVRMRQKVRFNRRVWEAKGVHCKSGVWNQLPCWWQRGVAHGRDCATAFWLAPLHTAVTRAPIHDDNLRTSFLCTASVPPLTPWTACGVHA